MIHLSHLAVLLVLALMLPVSALAADPISIDDPLATEVPDEGLYVTRQFTPVKTMEDVGYGQNLNHRSEVQDLLLDVWEPVEHDEEFRPVVVWFHGGGFVHGSHRSLGWTDQFIERGYVVVSATYRLRPGQPGSFEGILQRPEETTSVLEAALDAIEDGKAAVRWVRANAHPLRIDQTRIVTAGESAGGFIALGVAFDHRNPGDSGMPGWPSHVAAAAQNVGAYMGGLTGDHPRPGDPPVQMHHGTHDTIVPLFASPGSCGQTLAVGNTCEYHLYPGAGHSLPHDQVRARALDFIYRHVIRREQTASEFTDLNSSAHGDLVTAQGRLVTEDGRALAGDRVLARSVHGDWYETTTAPDGTFELDLTVPDHGRSTDVLLRFEGRSQASWLLTEEVGPAAATLTVTWGGGR